MYIVYSIGVITLDKMDVYIAVYGEYFINILALKCGKGPGSVDIILQIVELYITPA